MPLKLNSYTSGHKVEPKIEREVVPIKINTERTARFFFVAIKNYDFIGPIDEIYYQMWYEEQFPYYQLNIDSSRFEVWEKMRKKREQRNIRL
ncbi:MAG: hypothetical protein IKN63_05340 [Bacilli bacterium]|nr:hypothetical protein [Bacilli bacterium]